MRTWEVNRAGILIPVGRDNRGVKGTCLRVTVKPGQFSKQLWLPNPAARLTSKADIMGEIIMSFPQTAVVATARDHRAEHTMKQGPETLVSHQGVSVP